MVRGNQSTLTVFVVGRIVKTVIGESMGATLPYLLKTILGCLLPDKLPLPRWLIGKKVMAGCSGWHGEYSVVDDSISTRGADVIEWVFRSVGIVLFLVLGILVPRTGGAQIDSARRAIPRLSYYRAIAELRQGHCEAAARGFRSELRGAIKTPQSRWVDSICYHAMLGETHYQLGQHRHALEQFDAALNMFLTFPDWMLRVQFPSLAAAKNLGNKVPPWGRSSRPFQLGYFPDMMLVAQGQVEHGRAIKQGGTVQLASLLPVNVHEIIRCTALAIRRRRELLGPLCKDDRLSSLLVSGLQGPTAPNNHWSECWSQLNLGLALAGVEDFERAKQYLKQSLLAGDRYDHPLTCVAMVELGKLALDVGQLKVASNMFAEASYAAFYFGNVGVLEESFRQAMQAHLMSGARSLLSPVAAAAPWAKRKRHRQLQVWLALLAAENLAVIDRTQQAQMMLKEAQNLFGRRDMSLGVLGSQRNYVAALVAFGQNRPQQGQEALAAAIGFARTKTPWAFQIVLTDEWYAGPQGNISPRLALPLYQQVLRDPTSADWARNPLASLAVLATPHSASYENWFDAALKRKEINTALEVADRARRHRFLSTLPMGGRLMSLRWVLAAPAEWFDQGVPLRRQELLIRYPEYQKLARRAETLQHELTQNPLLPDDENVERQQRLLLHELTQVSLLQEGMLRQIALRREPVDLVFPPQKEVTQVQQHLPEGHAVVAFFATAERLYGFLITRKEKRLGSWVLSSPVRLKKKTAELLKKIGNYNQSRALTLDMITDDQWQETACELTELLFKDSPVDLSGEIEELVVVPDGFLWYLPFESLMVERKEGDFQPLLSCLRLRYAPTVSLAVNTAGSPGRAAATAVVLGKLHPTHDATVAAEAFESLEPVLLRPAALQGPLPGQAPVVASLIDGLVVLDEVDPRDPYGWSPLGLNRGSSSGGLRDWFLLPWGGPRWVVLPGFHTAAERAMQGARGAVPGNDIFLSVCGLMSCGAKTVLLSRWCAGGQTGIDLVREFAQEVPYMGAADAWQRSVQLTMERPVEPDREPRIKPFSTDDPPVADHPFFWAGYLLVDGGPTPVEQELAEPPQDPDELFQNRTAFPDGLQ